MRSLRFYRLFAGLAIVCAAFISLSALMMFATPPVYAQQQAPTPPPFVPAEIPPPAQMPLASLGQASFLQNCAPCHGEQGKSDGPSVSGLPAPPPQLADPATIWARSPAEYFHIVKFGRIQKFMPPWGDHLNDTQIWQTLYYAWSLHTDQAKVQSGAQLYAQTCTECHGASGQGDGPKAKGKLPNFADSAQMIVQTQVQLSEQWKKAHPTIGQDWSEDQRRNVLDYIRTFSYTPPWESAFRAGNGLLQGQVHQGTPGGSPVTTLPITLTAYANFTPVKTFTTTTDAKGQFTFPNLSTDEGVVYIAEAAYANVQYNSNIYALTPVTPTQNIDLPVYETTTDGSGVHMSRSLWIIDQKPGVLVIDQILDFSNQLDRTFLGRPVQGLAAPATLALQIPAKATDIQFQDGTLGDRYKQIGDRIYDVAPLLPGEEVRQIYIQYRVPFENDATKIEQQLLYPVGQLNLLIPDLPNLQVEVTGLKANQPQTVQGVAYRFWSGDNLPTQTISVNLSGLIPTGGTDPRAVAAASTAGTGAVTTVPLAATPPLKPAVPIAVGGVLLVALAAVVILPLRKQKTMDRALALQQEKAALIQNIAQLDDQHDTNELETSVWAQERAELKSQLLAVAREIALEEKK
ncbi:MAG: c-type cytochrome [Chloroflexi bacterium]|nr:c-type cytochrome [Chloroflexota bacterium]